MRKLLALLLALAVVFSLALPVFADAATPSGDPVTDDATSAKPADVKIYKAYGSGETFTASAKHPDETLTLTIKADTGNQTPNTGSNETAFLPSLSGSGVTEITSNIPSEADKAYSVVISDTNGYQIPGSDAAEGAKPGQPITVEFPTYDKVGIWKYTIAEVAGNTAGVTYDTNPIYIYVMVARKVTPGTDGAADTESLVASAYITDNAAENTAKKDTFQNTYKYGNLDIEKKIEGNLASSTTKFTIWVEFKTGANKRVQSTIKYGINEQTAEIKPTDTGWTGNDTSGYTYKTSIELKGGETMHFIDIPADVEFTVWEDSKHVAVAGQDKTNDPTAGYTLTYEHTGGTDVTDADSVATGSQAGTKGSIDGTETTTAEKVTVNNKKESNIATGVILDSAPYVLLLAVAVIGLAVVISKKRAARD